MSGDGVGLGTGDRLERPDVTGVVSVGQYPAITGPDLAEAFGTRLGRDVVFGPITPKEMRASIARLIGEGAAADIAGAYRAMSTMPGRSIAPEASAQKLLGVTPPDHGSEAGRHRRLTVVTAIDRV